MIGMKEFTHMFSIPNFFGPVGRGDDMETFHNAWRTKAVSGKNILVVGRRDNKGGCFCIMPWEEGYAVAHYYETPRDVFEALKIGGSYLAAAYFQTDPRNKYVCMDLIAYLKRMGEW